MAEQKVYAVRAEYVEAKTVYVSAASEQEARDRLKFKDAEQIRDWDQDESEPEFRIVGVAVADVEALPDDIKPQMEMQG